MTAASPRRRTLLLLAALTLGAAAAAPRWVDWGAPVNPDRVFPFLRDALAVAAVVYLMGRLVEHLLARSARRADRPAWSWQADGRAAVTSGRSAATRARSGLPGGGPVTVRLRVEDGPAGRRVVWEVDDADGVLVDDEVAGLRDSRMLPPGRERPLRLDVRRDGTLVATHLVDAGPGSVADDTEAAAPESGTQVPGGGAARPPTATPHLSPPPDWLGPFARHLDAAARWRPLPPLPTATTLTRTIR